MYKYVSDYIPLLKEKFPYLDEMDIKRMVEYGWRMFYFYNVRGCDISISSSKYDFWLYCGQLCNDSLNHYAYYKHKLRNKLRVMYSKKKILWDGYYYTNLTKEEYTKFFNRKGRKRINFEFNNKLIFKILDEAKVFFPGPKYIIKFKYPVDMGYYFEKDVLKCKNAEVVYVKETTDTFKDIMINENKYDLL